MKIKNIIIRNRAPFEDLNLTLSGDDIVVLSGINGSGKTTILSYIVDSFYELAKEGFHNEFEDKPYKYYRVSSDLFSVDSHSVSLVYLRFIKDDGSWADYIDIRGACSKKEYDSIIDIPDKIPFSTIDKQLQDSFVYKYWTITDNKDIRDIFYGDIMTYFPAYRYEVPYYLNTPYQVELSFDMNARYSGYLPNPIEVSSDLPNIANWIMDVVLDSELYGKSANYVYDQINDVITNILISKIGSSTRLGIGPRTSGPSRIAVMRGEQGGEQIYPSIFNMSSGELALVSIFCELIKQADRIRKTASNVSGIVLIDEIDKHLHIKLQKDILPKLIGLFPNVQFIVTSHSPFLSLGLESNNRRTYQIYDLDHGGVSCPPQDTDLFIEVYEMIINENDQYEKRYKSLLNKIENDTKPLIITEGASDWKHLQAALYSLGVMPNSIEFYTYEDTLGDRTLRQLLKDYARFPQPRKIIGIFDRDNIDELKWDELFQHEYIICGNNVFAFAIPLVNTEEYGENISIEHYYNRKDLMRSDKNGRRLFLGDEFYPSGASKDGKYITRCKSIDRKALINGIVDKKVYDIHNDLPMNNSVALSKNAFAELVLNQDELFKDMDFTEFTKVFDIIQKIIVL